MITLSKHEAVYDRDYIEGILDENGFLKGRIEELEKYMGADLSLLRDQKAQLNAVRKVLIEHEVEGWKQWHMKITTALEKES